MALTFFRSAVVIVAKN